MKLELNAAMERMARHGSHDRLSVLRDTRGTLIALADGVGTNAGAQIAAARTMSELARCFRNGLLHEQAEDWAMVLEGIDQIVLADPAAGETSALVMFVRDGVVVGASVGDSVAYLVSPEGESHVLNQSRRSPLAIGTGIACPVGFGPIRLDGKLVTRRAVRQDGQAAFTAAVA